MPYDERLETGEEERGDENHAGEPETGERRSGVSGFLGGLVIGALIGAGIALLVAPASGRSLRRRLVQGIRRAGEGVREELDDFKDAARRRLARRRHLRRADREES